MKLLHQNHNISCTWTNSFWTIIHRPAWKWEFCEHLSLLSITMLKNCLISTSNFFSNTRESTPKRSSVYSESCLYYFREKLEYVLCKPVSLYTAWDQWKEKLMQQQLRAMSHTPLTSEASKVKHIWRKKLCKLYRGET